jgi:hypothetical protein
LTRSSVIRSAINCVAEPGSPNPVNGSTAIGMMPAGIPGRGDGGRQ